MKTKQINEWCEVLRETLIESRNKGYKINIGVFRSINNHLWLYNLMPDDQLNLSITINITKK